MKTEHLDKLLSNLATPYWVTEVSRRLERVDIVDAINGLEALARALDADHKAAAEERVARYEALAKRQERKRQEREAKKQKASKHQWRGINWLHVSHIERGIGGSVVVHFIHDRPPHTLDHYPGEGTFARAENELQFAKRSIRQENGK